MNVIVTFDGEVEISQILRFTKQLKEVSKIICDEYGLEANITIVPSTISEKVRDGNQSRN